MKLIKWSPLYDMFDLDRTMDVMPSFRSMMPAIDMYEKDNNVIVEAELAGIDPKNVKLSIEDNILSLEASEERKREVDETNYYRKEVRSGSFHRVITLPTTVDADQTKASYDKGILTITMPKKEEIKSKPITIDITK